ncbi:diguanylate cyclase [Bradyrhizobium sp.]
MVGNFNAARALAAAEMVRAAVQDLGMPHATSVYQSVTVSVGVACTTPSDAQAPKDLIEAADAALYAAKHRGRNAVVEHGLVRAEDAGGMAIAS